MTNWTKRERKHVKLAFTFLVASILLHYTKYEIVSNLFYFIAGAIAYNILYERREKEKIGLLGYGYFLIVLIVAGILTVRNMANLLGVNI